MASAIPSTFDVNSAELSRLRAENAALRGRIGAFEQERYFRALVEAMPQLVWTCTADGRCDYLGPQWVAYTGAPEAEQLGLGWLEQIHPDDRQPLRAEWARCSAAGLPLDIDFRIRRSDGVYRWFKTRAVPELDSDGKVQRWLGTNTDVDDLRHAEAKLRTLSDDLSREVSAQGAELELVSERLMRATRAARVGVWDWDIVSNRLVWDTNMYALYGLDPAQFSGAYEAWQQALHPDDKAQAGVAVERALRDQHEHELELSFRVVTSSAELRHIHALATIERAADGAPLRMLGVNWDITREAQALEQLALTEERWNFALQGTGDGVWDWNVMSGEVFLSLRAREMLGYPPDGDVPRDLSLSSVHPDDTGRALEAMQAHLRGETPTFSCEYRVQRRDGKYYWVHGRGRVMARDEHGNPTRVVGTYKDVSERRRAQDALEHREALLREFIAHTPAAIAVLDRDMRYLQASNRWLTDYKLVGRDIIGKSHYQVFPDIPQRWKDIHQRVLAGAVESCDEDPFPRENGETEWLQWEARPWHEADGAIGGLIFFTQVITARKQLELALAERNEQLSRSNAELEQFAYVASHDLQEPLRAVAGCTQLLAQRYRGKLDADADTLVTHIVDGAGRMKALIEGLLSLSRVTSQREHKASVVAGEVVEQALKNLDSAIKAASAEVSVEPLPQLKINPLQLQQLMQNLIGNAIKYRSAAPPVIRVSAERLDASWKISVADNGIGIDSRHFTRIFGVFQRLHTREEYPGTGIGLAICRKIVEGCGGRIWLDSQPGSGSTFHFTIPS
jgi:PAS domain S-box-containing protein